MIVLTYNSMDSLICRPFSTGVKWWVQLTGWSNFALARILLVAAYASMLTGSLVAGEVFGLVATGVIVLFWVVAHLLFTVPRWEKSMSYFKNGMIPFYVFQQIRWACFERMMFFGFFAGTLLAGLVLLDITPIFTAGYALFATFFHYACTISVDPGPSAKDRAKAKIKELAARLKPSISPVPVPA